MSAILDYLKHQVEQLEHFNNSQHICKYRSVGHFVLEHGRHWTPRKKPSYMKWRELKNCFGNSANLAMETDLIYCEGFAVDQFFPMLHAWCLTTSGAVIDVTWRRLGAEYFGIAIRPDYLSHALSLQPDYGLIDNWKMRWPMMHNDPKLWRHPINDALARSDTSPRV